MTQTYRWCRWCLSHPALLPQTNERDKEAWLKPPDGAVDAWAIQPLFDKLIQWHKLTMRHRGPTETYRWCRRCLSCGLRGAQSRCPGRTCARGACGRRLPAAAESADNTLLHAPCPWCPTAQQHTGRVTDLNGGDRLGFLAHRQKL